MIFYEFLQVALGIRENLSRPFTDKEWRQCFAFCERQALLGIGFSGVERLHAAGVSCPVELRRKWYVLVVQIERLNDKLNAQCRTLSERLDRDGFNSCILKGQSNQTVYPESLGRRRTPGDIDVWCRTKDGGVVLPMRSSEKSVTFYGQAAIRRYVNRKYEIMGLKINPKDYYHHIEAPDFEGTAVEVHYRPSFLHSPIRNRRLQHFFSIHADECMKNKTALGFTMPVTPVNVVFQMCHLFMHYMESGLGLRQVMDYYFTLRSLHGADETEMTNRREETLTEKTGARLSIKDEVEPVLQSVGLKKFTSAVMWVLHEVFDLPSPYYIFTPDEKEGRRLLDEIMLGGNFGHFDERERDLKNGGRFPHAVWKLKRALRLLRSYPEEALCEPLFMLWHWCWRMRFQENKKTSFYI